MRSFPLSSDQTMFCPPVGIRPYHKPERGLPLGTSPCDLRQHGWRQQLGSPRPSGRCNRASLEQPAASHQLRGLHRRREQPPSSTYQEHTLHGPGPGAAHALIGSLDLLEGGQQRRRRRFSLHVQLEAGDHRVWINGHDSEEMHIAPGNGRLLQVGE